MDENKSTDNVTNGGPAESNTQSNPVQPGSEQNVYSVGGTYNGTYTPPAGDIHRGEYSYGQREQIPDYRYNFTQPGQQTQPPKRKKPHRGGMIALIIAAAVLLCTLAGLGGALVTNLVINNDIPVEQGTSGPDGTDALPGSTDEDITPETDAPTEAIIVKNNGSVSVKTVGGSIGDENLTLPDVVALVKDSVVEIATETSVYNGRYVVSGAGSGVIISRADNGKTAYIVTNNHVVEGADSITVRTTDGSEYAATLRGTDSSSDIAVLSISIDREFTAAELGSSKNLVVGESVIAIGNPLGELGGTVTNGIISALAREVDIDGSTMMLLQTNAAVNPGNSGGGLFNMKGELIGIVNAKSSGSDIDNIGFAIPVDTAYDIIKELISYGYVTGRVDAGLTLVDVTDTYSAWYYDVKARGVYVIESKYSEDIKSGDRIVAVNGTEVSSTADIKSILSECKVGDEITVRISRNSKQYDIKLTLREYVPAAEKTK